MEDPVRDLNNYLQEVQAPENLTRFLRFTTQQTGPNNQAVHAGTYTFRGVVIGTGDGTSKAIAKRNAATNALQYLRAQGIPE